MPHYTEVQIVKHVWSCTFLERVTSVIRRGNDFTVKESNICLVWVLDLRYVNIRCGEIVKSRIQAPHHVVVLNDTRLIVEFFVKVIDPVEPVKREYERYGVKTTKIVQVRVVVARYDNRLCDTI